MLKSLLRLEMKMYRFFTTLAIVLLAVGLVWQHRSVNRLAAELADSQYRMESLELEVAKKHDMADLFYRFIVNNHKSIQELRRSRLLTVTAYSPRIGETDDSPNYTATNRRVRHGIVAVSRDLFKAGWVFGKKVYIKDYGVFTIDDLMAKHKRNQIDIFMFDTDAALQFGKKRLEVHLIDL